MVQYAKCRKAVDRFLKSGRIGSIGHISCIDRRPLASQEAVGTAHYARVGASQLAALCELLDRSPMLVTARTREEAGAASLQVFLQLDEQTRVHYFATFDAAPAEHQLWIEGSDGSLQTNGNSVWWRKRGWPKFIPTRIGLLSARSEMPAADPVGDSLTAAIVDSISRQETVGLANA
ncbi:MAG: hypothetical protein ACR2QS_03905 [Woeseiaceae bacterium]